MTRPWTELVSSDDAVEFVRSWSRESPTHFVIAAAVPQQGQRVLERLQISTRSPLGAVALHTGGIVVDGGWLRVLGSGSSQVPRSLDEWNGLAERSRKPVPVEELWSLALDFGEQLRGVKDGTEIQIRVTDETGGRET